MFDTAMLAKCPNRETAVWGNLLDIADFLTAWYSCTEHAKVGTNLYTSNNLWSGIY